MYDIRDLHLYFEKNELKEESLTELFTNLANTCLRLRVLNIALSNNKLASKSVIDALVLFVSK